MDHKLLLLNSKKQRLVGLLAMLPRCKCRQNVRSRSDKKSCPCSLRPILILSSLLSLFPLHWTREKAGSCRWRCAQDPDDTAGCGWSLHIAPRPSNLQHSGEHVKKLRTSEMNVTPLQNAKLSCHSVNASTLWQLNFTPDLTPCHIGIDHLSFLVVRYSQICRTRQILIHKMPLLRPRCPYCSQGRQHPPHGTIPLLRPQDSSC